MSDYEDMARDELLHVIQGLTNELETCNHHRDVLATELGNLKTVLTRLFEAGLALVQ